MRLAVAALLLAPALLLGADTPAEEEVTWRPVSLAEATDKALRDNVQRTCDRLLTEHFQGIELEKPRYQVETDGEEYRVVFETVIINLTKLKEWSGEIIGRIELHDLTVRYGPLSLAKLDLLSEPFARIYIDAAVDNLEEYLDERGIAGAYIDFPEETGDMEFGGSFRLKFLFLKWHPKLRVRGEWAREEDRHVFQLNDLYVSRCPGFIRARIRTSIERVSRGGFGLQQGLQLLTDDGMAIDMIDLTFRRDGEVVYHKAIER